VALGLLEDNWHNRRKIRQRFLSWNTPTKPRADAIIRVYATLKPEALLYRRSKGLQDYDERMAILIQVVQGEQYGQYYLPQSAGVAFSRNLYRWAPQIRREDGFARLVWGLGTRAVERVGNDYPHPVALSHPMLRPTTDQADPALFAAVHRPDRPERKYLQDSAGLRGAQIALSSLRYLAQVDATAISSRCAARCWTAAWKTWC
jgi:hypothetical protein